ncbi:MAG: AtpZ/AtpI family protein [Gemmatimonas sp.]
MTSEPKRTKASKQQASPASNTPESAPTIADATPPAAEFNPGAVASLGLQFAVALIACGYAGQWLDRKYDTAPIFLMIGVFFGGGGTFFLSYRRLMALQEKKP